MQASEARRAVAAALRTASSLGIPADDAVVLHDSNKLTLHLLPGDVVARVAPPEQQVARFEISLAQRVAEAGGPVAAPDPRVEARAYESDGFVMTLWAYHAPAPAGEIPPADYARALERLHAAMRTVDLPTPHFTDRVDEAQRLVADRARTPDLVDADRELLDDTLRTCRRSIEERGPVEQLLHGEPHPGNVLATGSGLLFVDFETCCRGPVEFDLAHAPDEVADHYPGLDPGLLRDCRTLMLAMITMWRWDRDDQLPDGRRLAAEWLAEIRDVR
jgi:Ser/Thr protein kinase RdoA (MazF antagonist)